jgi:hypothetical protein
MQNIPSVLANTARRTAEEKDLTKLASLLCLVLASCVLGLILGSCGSDRESETYGLSRTKQYKLTVKSPVVGEEERIPRPYKCNEKSIWLPLEWSEIPYAAQELILVSSVSRLRHVFGKWNPQLVDVSLIGGLNPGLQSLKIGPLPKGTYRREHVGQRFCPPKTELSGIVFALYALPIQQRLWRNEKLDIPTLEVLERSALAVGVIRVLYGSNVNS